MNKPKKHSLLVDDKQYDIIFMHKGIECALSYGRNELNNNWMWWWTKNGVTDTSMYASPDKKDVMAIVNNIREKSEKVLLDTF